MAFLFANQSVSICARRDAKRLRRGCCLLTSPFVLLTEGDGNREAERTLGGGRPARLLSYGPAGGSLRTTCALPQMTQLVLARRRVGLSRRRGSRSSADGLSANQSRLLRTDGLNDTRLNVPLSIGVGDDVRAKTERKYATG